MCCEITNAPPHSVSDANNNNNHITEDRQQHRQQPEESLASSCQVGSGQAAGAAAAGSSSQRNGNSSKEKKRRQKEAEKVEKLRMLVSYLKSGTSQPLLNPVTLEADELELAQRYKLHLILCEDCLQATEAAVSASTPGSSTFGLQPGQPAASQLSGSRTPDSQKGCSTTIAGIVINVRRSSDLPSLPASSHQLFSAASSPSIDASVGADRGHSLLQLQQQQPQPQPHPQGAFTSMNSASSGHLSPNSHQNQQQLQQQLLCYKCNKPTGRNRSSIMSSVDLTTTASLASDIDSTVSTSENATANANQHQQHQQQHDPFEPQFCQLHHYHHHHHHHPDHGHSHQFSSRQESPQMSESQQEDDNDSRGFLSSCRSMPSQSRGSVLRRHQSSTNPLIGNVSWLLRHSISDPGSSQLGASSGFQIGRQVGSGSSFNSSGSGGNSNNNAKLKSGQCSSSNQTSPKLFYIDDYERKSSDSSDTNSQFAAAVNAVAAANRNQQLEQQLEQRRDKQHKGTISSSEAIRDLPARSWSSELFLSSTPTTTTTTTKTSAWTNPQNFATWIDNEVNSLVHDLETKSQLAVDEKPAKSSKPPSMSRMKRRIKAMGLPKAATTTKTSTWTYLRKLGLEVGRA